jgi:hypothetical protein
MDYMAKRMPPMGKESFPTKSPSFIGIVCAIHPSQISVGAEFDQSKKGGLWKRIRSVHAFVPSGFLHTWE